MVGWDASCRVGGLGSIPSRSNYFLKSSFFVRHTERPIHRHRHTNTHTDTHPHTHTHTHSKREKHTHTHTHNTYNYISYSLTVIKSSIVDLASDRFIKIVMKIALRMV